MLAYFVLQAKAACVLIDLCCGVLAPWLSQVVAKVCQRQISFV